MVHVTRLAIAAAVSVAALSACTTADVDRSLPTTQNSTFTLTPPKLPEPKRAPIPVANQNDEDEAEPGSIPLPRTVSLRVMDSPVGEILVTPSGRAVYYFQGDDPKTGESSCDDQCVIHWPPVNANTDPPQAEGVSAELGIYDRPNGIVQVTVNGRPVYFYRNDVTPGSINGQGLANMFYLVAPDGKMIRPY